MTWLQDQLNLSLYPFNLPCLQTEIPAELTGGCGAPSPGAHITQSINHHAAARADRSPAVTSIKAPPFRHEELEVRRGDRPKPQCSTRWPAACPHTSQQISLGVCLCSQEQRSIRKFMNWGIHHSKVKKSLRISSAFREHLSVTDPTIRSMMIQRTKTSDLSSWERPSHGQPLDSTADPANFLREE